MQAPSPHVRERERLAAVRALDLLDTAPEPKFDRIAQLAAHIMGTPIAAVTLVDAKRQWFKAITGLNIRETPRSISFCGHAINEASLFLVGSAQEDLRFTDNPLVTGEPRIGFYAGVPILDRAGLPLGTLCAIDHVSRRPDAAQLAALEHLAAILADELRLRTVAGIDSLTGLNNRRALLPQLERELARSRREGAPLALIAIDMDGLKGINDRHGHAAGDQALRDIAKALRAAARRPTDVLARTGGDEFLMLLGDCDPEMARQRCLAVLDNVRAGRNPDGGPLSVSVGAACVVNPGRIPNSETLQRAADRTQYQAKRDGGNDFRLMICGDRRRQRPPSLSPAVGGPRRRRSDLAPGDALARQRLA